MSKFSGPYGRGTQFVDIKLKVPPHHELVVHSGAATCVIGFEKCFPRVPQAVTETYRKHNETFSTSFRPRLY